MAYHGQPSLLERIDKALILRINQLEIQLITKDHSFFDKQDLETELWMRTGELLYPNAKDPTVRIYDNGEIRKARPTIPSRVTQVEEESSFKKRYGFKRL